MERLGGFLLCRRLLLERLLPFLLLDAMLSGWQAGGGVGWEEKGVSRGEAATALWLHPFLLFSAG